MFGLFKTSEVDVNKVNGFAEWFCSNEERIRKSVENSATDHDEMMRVLDEVELELGKVYRDGYKGSIEFDYGGGNPVWELNLYHLNNKFLKRATSLIAEAIDKKGLIGWRVNIDQ